MSDVLDAAAPVVGGVGGFLVGGPAGAVAGAGLGSALAGGGGSALGLQSSDSESRAGQLAQMALAERLPSERAKVLRRTELGRIKEDPALRNAQMAALNQFGEFARGALTPADIARQRQEQALLAQQEQGQRGALQQSFARRGLGGSGLAQAALLANQQSSAQQQNANVLGLEQLLQERQLGAVGQQGTLAGQIRGNEYAQNAERAKAQDLINQFNIANQQAQAQQGFQNRLQRYVPAENANRTNATLEENRIGRLGNTIGNAAYFLGNKL